VSEAAPLGHGFPVVVLAAAVLAAEQVSSVLVGSAGLWLRGEQVTVADADVVIEPGQANLRRLHESLAGLAVRPETVPAVHRLRELSMAPVLSSYGRVDCLLERGRLDWDQLRRALVTWPWRIVFQQAGRSPEARQHDRKPRGA
jgi:hypothetical protein